MQNSDPVSPVMAKCPACGAYVPPTMKFCVNCGVPMPEQRLCPKCRAPITGNPEFCRSCGFSLQPQKSCPKCRVPITGNPEFCRSCGAPLSPSRMCPSCGAPLSATAKFCKGCGRVLDTVQGTGVSNVNADKAQELLDQAEKFGKIPEIPNKDFSRYDTVSLQKVITTLEKFLTSATPDLLISLNRSSLSLSTWHKMEIQITNTGSAHAFYVTFSFSSDFETRRIKPTTVEAGKTELVEIGILPKMQGNIPIEITLNYKDGNNRDYKKTTEFWIDVVPQGMTLQYTSPPPGAAAQSSSEPATPHVTPRSAAQGTVTMKALPPEMSEKYVESEFIGKGGFARVFKAKRKDGLYVAVKVPINLDESTGKSFIAEMQNWTKFNHPNIVKIYDYNIMPFPYFEEELCDSSLDKEKKPMDPAKAAWIIFNICEGLKYAHARQVIHRDLKPQNILLKSGIPKISDWGLSKVVTDASSVTTTSFTPFYAAPEQVTNKPKDQRTDIWQVGVILYELVTGTLPFTGDSMIEIVSNIPTKTPVLPGDINPDAKKIEPTIMKCIEKDPAKRYQSVVGLQKDLATILKIDYTESLRMSVGGKNYRQSAEYCSRLLLAALKSGDLNESYKYASDLVTYSEGDIRGLVKDLADQIRIRIDNQISDVPDEIIESADLIAHKISMGLTTL